jgi:hypothetical protein
MNAQIDAPVQVTPAPDARSRSAMAPLPLAPITLGSDPLADLEFRIARRADEIAATLPARTDLNLYCWLKAEHEVLAGTGFLGRPLREIR